MARRKSSPRLPVAAATGLALLAIGALHGAAAQEAPSHPPLLAPQLPPFKSTPPADSFILPPLPEEIPKPPPAGETIRVGRFAYVGNTRIASEELDALAASYVDRPLSLADLEELRQRLTRHYVDAGFINSGVLIRPGAFDGQTLTLTVIEGRVSVVRLRGLGHLHEGYVVPRLLPDEAAPLNVNELRERFQILLADPLFARAQARLIPDAVPGRAILDIDAERARPYQLTLTGDNSRTASVGEKTLGLSGWVRNLSGWGDYLEVNLQQGEAPAAGNRRQGFLWSIPLGASGSELSFFADTNKATVIEEPNKDLDINSTQTSREIRLAHKLLENLQQKLSLGATYSQRSSRSFMDVPFSFAAGEIDGTTRIEGWRFWQEYAHRWETQAVVLRSTFLTNHNNLESMANAPAQDNAIWLGQTNFAKRLFDSKLQFSLRGTVQRTDQRLPGMDRLAIGGAQSVRGFRENQLIKDQGEIVNFDLEYPLWGDLGESGSLSLGLFHDTGSGYNRGEPRDRLTSSGLTVKGKYRNFQIGLAYAVDRRHSADVAIGGNSWQDRGLHLQFSYALFD